MAALLHLIKADSPELAGAVIAAGLSEPGARVTLVLLGNAAAPALPPGATVRRLAEGDLDYPGLLDLIFAHDRVIAW